MYFMQPDPNTIATAAALNGMQANIEYYCDRRLSGRALLQFQDAWTLTEKARHMARAEAALLVAQAELRAIDAVINTMINRASLWDKLRIWWWVGKRTKANKAVVTACANLAAHGEPNRTSADLIRVAHSLINYGVARRRA